LRNVGSAKSILQSRIDKVCARYKQWWFFCGINVNEVIVSWASAASLAALVTLAVYKLFYRRAVENLTKKNPMPSIGLSKRINYRRVKV
jgi:hypothetical protein